MAEETVGTPETRRPDITLPKVLIHQASESDKSEINAGLDHQNDDSSVHEEYQEELSAPVNGVNGQTPEPSPETGESTSRGTDQDESQENASSDVVTLEGDGSTVPDSSQAQATPNAQEEDLCEEISENKEKFEETTKKTFDESSPPNSEPVPTDNVNENDDHSNTPVKTNSGSPKLEPIENAPTESPIQEDKDPTDNPPDQTRSGKSTPDEDTVTNGGSPKLESKETASTDSFFKDKDPTASIPDHSDTGRSTPDKDVPDAIPIAESPQVIKPVDEEDKKEIPPSPLSVSPQPTIAIINDDETTLIEKKSPTPTPHPDDVKPGISSPETPKETTNISNHEIDERSDSRHPQDVMGEDDTQIIPPEIAKSAQGGLSSPIIDHKDIVEEESVAYTTTHDEHSTLEPQQPKIEEPPKAIQETDANSHTEEQENDAVRLESQLAFTDIQIKQQSPSRSPKAVKFADPSKIAKPEDIEMEEAEDSGAVRSGSRMATDTQITTPQPSPSRSPKAVKFADQSKKIGAAAAMVLEDVEDSDELFSQGYREVGNEESEHPDVGIHSSSKLSNFTDESEARTVVEHAVTPEDQSRYSASPTTSEVNERSEAMMMKEVATKMEDDYAGVRKVDTSVQRIETENENLRQKNQDLVDEINRLEEEKAAQAAKLEDLQLRLARLASDDKDNIQTIKRLTEETKTLKEDVAKYQQNISHIEQQQQLNNGNSKMAGPPPKQKSSVCVIL